MPGLPIAAVKRTACALALFFCLTGSLLGPRAAAAARPEDQPIDQAVPAPQAAPRRVQPTTPIVAPPRTPPVLPVVDQAKAQAERLKRIGAARSWGYQLLGLSLPEAVLSPYDLIVVDATSGLSSQRPFTPAEVEKLKRKPDGSRRLVISYLSIGEAEDYRPDYFAAEYMTEDAPEWLGPENPQWKANRIVVFCHEGWQRTVLGDEQGRSVYNSVEASPLYRLIELGFDGVYLDRVDVYGEVKKDCPEGDKKMVDFVARLANHARKTKPDFLVVLQNAEELVRHKKMMDTIDAIAKEDLFYGADHSQNLNKDAAIKESLKYLKAVKDANRPVFVVDYLSDTAKKADAKRRIQEQGFIPYIGPRDLGQLWLPGRDF